MSNKLIVALVILLVVIGGFFLFKDKGMAPTEIESVGENTTEESTVSQPSVKEFTVEAVPYSFSLSTMEVNKGDTVKITVKNTKGTHDLKIDEFNVGTRTLQAGEEQTITFVADKAGSFHYYCSVGNHRAQGMWGTLTIK